ncbi:uncharacterized protein LOC125850704 [Solanum stenotomum]|uniref:uncharacterized protein LOC125850704 n=1 Tax=Solanum stenotomum TaxID=172797 RepID=UPI0020D05F74|nr:uncharacterized protein LOC125850704 [Solanum stenotomum]
MSNLSKLEFVALDISGNNYLSWVLDAEIHLDANGLGATITNGNTASSQDKAKAMIFLRHHLDEGLKQQYRERGFKKYSELISCLLVAEQHNTLLLKNHEARPTGTAPLPKANKVEAHGQSERRQNKNQSQNNVRRRDNGRGRYNNHRGGGRHKRENNMGSQSNSSRSNCHRCGMKGHWKNECRAAKHFGGPSQKYDDNIEANLALKDDDFDDIDDGS